MKIVIPAVLLLALIVGGGVAARQEGWGPFKAELSVTLPPPTTLVQRLPGAAHSPIAANAWINRSVVDLAGMRAGVTGKQSLQVELVPARAQFAGTPTATGSPGTGDPSVLVRHLRSGGYRWWARFYSGSAVSPWVEYSAGPSFRVDLQPPSTPLITSATDPRPGTVYHSPSLSFSWRSLDTGSGVYGYWYRFDTTPTTFGRAYVRSATPSLSLTGITTGKYYLHVRARDRAGNWGGLATFPVVINTTPPQIAHIFFSRYQFNPQFQTLGLSFGVTKPAHVRIGVYSQATNALVRLVGLGTVSTGKRVYFTWRGRDDQGRPVAEGTYAIYVRTTDAYGNTALRGFGDLTVSYKRIVVSLSQQKLYAYDGNRLFLSSLVTTGNQALPTPTGLYDVMAKFHPYKFISPWPKTSQYYYPPSPVNYALYFRSGGYFIHDAPWRSAFGPGTNAQLGIPGQNYTGTHGCVNTPYNVAYRLYYWAPIGTPVQVVH